MCSAEAAADLYVKSFSRLRLRVARLLFFALRNIALGVYLDTRRTFTVRRTDDLK